MFRVDGSRDVVDPSQGGEAGSVHSVDWCAGEDESFVGDGDVTMISGVPLHVSGRSETKDWRKLNQRKQQREIGVVEKKKELTLRECCLRSNGTSAWSWVKEELDIRRTIWEEVVEA